MQNVPGKCTLHRLPILRCGQPAGVGSFSWGSVSSYVRDESILAPIRLERASLFKTVDFKPRGRTDGAKRPIAHEKSLDPSSPSGFSDQGSPYPTQDGFGRHDSKRRTGPGVV